MTETELKTQTIAIALRLGLMVLEIPDSRRLKVGLGYPDLTFFGPREVLYAELKTEGGKLSRDQQRWRYRLLQAGWQWRLWRPCHLKNGEIELELRRIA